MNTVSETHQPRERAVPCWRCGPRPGRNGQPTPRTMTWSPSGVCDAHETVQAIDLAAYAGVAS